MSGNYEEHELPLCWCGRDVVKLCRVRCDRTPSVANSDPAVCPISWVPHDVLGLIIQRIWHCDGGTPRELVPLLRVNKAIQAKTTDVILKTFLDSPKGNEVLAEFMRLAPNVGSHSELVTQFEAWTVYDKCRASWCPRRMASFAIFVNQCWRNNPREAWKAPRVKKLLFENAWQLVKHCYAPRYEGSTNPLIKFEDMAKRARSLAQLNAKLQKVEENYEDAQDDVRLSKERLQKHKQVRDELYEQLLTLGSKRQKLATVDEDWVWVIIDDDAE